MRLNTSKCKILFIPSTAKSTPPHITLNDHHLEIVNSYKYLGVELNAKLDWSQQWDRVHHYIRSVPFLVKQLKRLGFREHILISVYRSLAISHLNYSSPVLISTSVAIKHEIADFQKRILRIIGISSIDAKIKYGITDTTELIENNCIKKLIKILADPNHPITTKAKSNNRTYARIKINTVKTRTVKYKNSMVQKCIRIIRDGTENLYRPTKLEDFVKKQPLLQRREKAPEIQPPIHEKPKAPCPNCGKLYEAKYGVKVHTRSCKTVP